MIILILLTTKTNIEAIACSSVCRGTHRPALLHPRSVVLPLLQRTALQLPLSVRTNPGRGMGRP
uniref:Uncharacterized protein n=1 Tax=Arundo donax TaxID=35708 RepID=A0A0A8Y8J2_ARUDO